MSDVTFRYGGPPVLDGVSFEVQAGRFDALIGPSGCGKSTLLRLVAGLLSAEAGELRVGDASPGTGNAEVELVFQEPTLMPWLTVRDNIALPLRLRGVGREQRWQTAAQLAARVGLAGFLDYHPRELSGGMRMRVSLARALALSPRVMLFDEPFAGLDAIRRDALNEELLAVQQREGWTALLVTHSVPEAVFLSSRVCVMGANPGRIHRCYEVPLPYPRTAALRSSTEFLSLVGSITEGLREVVR